MRGRVEPRLWTPPLRPLTPETSFGFDVAEFARDVLCHPLDPWQEWQVIHAGELLPDGRPRFRVVHTIVARQNGKTEIPVILSLYWQVVENVPMILGTSTKLDYARESWMKAVTLAERAPGLEGLVPSHRSLGPAAVKRRRDWTRQANGEQESWLCDSRYKIAAANEEGGRSLTVHRLILDELRQHHDYSAWDAAVPAGSAVRDFQVWTLSNAGTARSVVLNDERESALAYIDTGQGDYRTGWFEWSAPDGADPQDLTALAQANPNLGHRIDPEALLSDARKAVMAGGAKLAGFRTESMCQSVMTLDPVIDAELWGSRIDPASRIAGRVAVSLEVALDRSVTSISVAGYRSDGRVHVEVTDQRPGSSWAPQRVADLVAKWAPVMVCLDPSSPSGALAADLRKLSVEVYEMAGSEVATAFSGFVSSVEEGHLAHLGQPWLADAIAAAGTRPVGDGGTAWGRRRSGRDISAVISATNARWALLEVIPEPPADVWGFVT